MKMNDKNKIQHQVKRIVELLVEKRYTFLEEKDLIGEISKLEFIRLKR